MMSGYNVLEGMFNGALLCLFGGVVIWYMVWHCVLCELTYVISDGVGWEVVDTCVVAHVQKQTLDGLY
jgi:hypothetical protein